VDGGRWSVITTGTAVLRRARFKIAQALRRAASCEGSVTRYLRRVSRVRIRLATAEEQ